MPEENRPKGTGAPEVYESNWDVVQLFLRLQTQWHFSPTGHRAGLVYSSIRPVCKVMGTPFTPEIFSDLQLMEITLINESLKHGNRRSQL